MPIEIGEQGVDRHILERAAALEIFHVPAAAVSNGLKQRLVLAVEFERRKVRTLAQHTVEGRRAFDPGVADLSSV